MERQLSPVGSDCSPTSNSPFSFRGCCNWNCFFAPVSVWYATPTHVFVKAAKEREWLVLDDTFSTRIFPLSTLLIPHLFFLIMDVIFSFLWIFSSKILMPLISILPISFFFCVSIIYLVLANLSNCRFSCLSCTNQNCGNSYAFGCHFGLSLARKLSSVFFPLIRSITNPWILKRRKYIKTSRKN